MLLPVIVAVAIFVAWFFVAWGAARWLIVADADVLRGRNVEAIAVLAGSSSYPERTAQAARIWREHGAACVVLTNDGERSGWLSSEQRNPLFVERARWALKDEGVAAERIEQLPQIVSSTYQEAVLLRDFAVKRGVRSIDVVTSPYHTRRARWILRRVFNGSGIAVHVSYSLNDVTPSTWWLCERGWRDVAAEYVKLIYYLLRH